MGWLAGVAGAFTLLTPMPAVAASANLSHSFHATSTIAVGSLVSSDTTRSDYVVLANTDNGAHLLGVAVKPSDSLLAVDPSNTTVQVATSGVASVLVSTLNGPIKVGDQIAVSPFGGVGMEARPESEVIGVAQSAFNTSSSGARTESVTDKQGQSHSISVGFIRLTIGVGLAPSSAQAAQNGLQRFGQSLTGHPVSTVRVVISLVIALAALAALIVLTYSSIYGSIIAVGRNPLAKNSIFRTLSLVLAMSLGLALLAAAAIFFILR